VSVKLLMTWDIIPGREQEYFEFVVREFIPEMQNLGLEPSDAWFTLYGDQPQIMAAANMPTLGELEGIMNSSEWQSLTNRLMDYVENYEFKVVPSRAGFQI
jgi:hypothetical protein